MNVIFDTNSVYYLESELSEHDFIIIKQKIITNKLQVFVSPITVIEMTSRLVECPLDFIKVKSAIIRLLKLNPTFLPDPEQQLSEYILDSKLDNNDYKNWKEIFISTSLAQSVDDLKTGINDFFSNIRTSVDINKIHTFRKSYENTYVSDMQNLLQSIVEDFNIKIGKNKNTRLPKNKTEDFMKYLCSPVWINQMKLMLENRTGIPLPNDENKVEIILKKASFFIKSYERLIIKIFRDGYVPNIKKKNDYNDLHFNIYFNEDNSFVFITSENNIVFEQLRNNRRCINLQELVKLF
jgi:hypothetical protein